MSNTDENEKIPIEPTCIFGTVNESSKRYDMYEILGEKLLDYRLTNITCFSKSNKSIYGIQFTYRNINDCKETTFIDVKSNEPDLIKQEMALNNEDIISLNSWITNDDINLIGFEITTNKKRSYKFGYGNDEEYYKVPDFEDLDNILIGFGCYADERDGITGLYGYFINRKKYISIIYEGIFSFRIALKNLQFKEKTEKNLAKMNEKNKILYKICLLPDNEFFSIIKYSID